MQYAGTAPSVAQLNTYAQAFAAQWTAHIAALCSTNVLLTQIVVQDLTSQTAAGTEQTVAGQGTRAGGQFPLQVALVSSWNANIRYRGGHPRTYWPAGVPTDTSDARTWNTAAITAFQAAFEAFRVGVNGIPAGTAAAQMILLSYFTAHALRPVPLPVTIGGVTVHPRIDTQRRRLGKEHA